jgi:hypothetical protein
MGLARTTSRERAKPTCIDDVVIYIDGLCIRCDKPDHAGLCTIRGQAWLDSLRCQLLRGLGLDGIVHAVRKDRALITLGRSRNEPTSHI